MKVHLRHRLVIFTGLLFLLPAFVNAGKSPIGGFRIVSPPDGTIVEPGQTFTVVVEPEPGITPAAVAIISPPIFTFKEEPPFVFPVSFPIDTPLGPKTLIADGVDGKERPLRGETIVNIETATPVQSITVKSLRVGRPATVSLRFGIAERRLRVEGTFADGISRDISRSREISFVSSDPEIATVTLDGLVEAVGEGTATITVTYKGRSTAVPVKVEFQKSTIPIDIEPGKFPNRIKLGSGGFIRVAILSTSSFDATTVEEESVKFGPAGAAADLEHAKVRDVNRDGERDLVLRFRIQETGVECLQDQATLTGATFGGVLIRGADSIRPRGKNCIEIRR